MNLKFVVFLCFKVFIYFVLDEKAVLNFVQLQEVQLFFNKLYNMSVAEALNVLVFLILLYLKNVFTLT